MRTSCLLLNYHLAKLVDNDDNIYLWYLKYGRIVYYGNPENANLRVISQTIKITVTVLK